MFTSKNDLVQSMGVDPEIAAFFVDRKVPLNNKYWPGRLLYVSRGTGYLFIPLFVDLQFKLGVHKDVLLNESHIQMMEAILDIAAKYEFKELSFNEHISRIEKLVESKIVHLELFNDLSYYSSQSNITPYKYLGLPIAPLNRGDALLYHLCTLPQTAPVAKIIEMWYALVPAFLLMDDLIDLQEDHQKNEENAVPYYGPGVEGIEKAVVDLEMMFQKIRQVNPILADYFLGILKKKAKTTFFKTLLNS